MYILVAVSKGLVFQVECDEDMDRLNEIAETADFNPDEDDITIWNSEGEFVYRREDNKKTGSAPKLEKKICKVIVEHLLDDDPDLSWLETEFMAGNRWIKGSCRYTNRDIKKYGLAQVRMWVEEDHRRLKRYGDTWCMIGIQAKAQVMVKIVGDSWICQDIRSGGLWGIESDSDEDFFKQVDEEELNNLRDNLLALGFKDDEINVAFKTVETGNDF